MENTTINLSGHIQTFGETQTGKSTTVNKIIKRIPYTVIIVDLEDVGDFSGKEINRKTTRSILETEIKKDKNRLVYVPAENPDTAKKEVMYLWKVLKSLNENVYLVIDEAQEYGNSTKNALDKMFVRGLKYGVHCWGITQRPSNISKTMASQSNTFMFMDFNEFEIPYMKDRNLPHEEIKNKLQDAPKHSFVVYERSKGVSNPVKI